MLNNEEIGFEISDLARRMANIIRIGKVFDLDLKTARARVKIGEIATDFLPFATGKAGATETWQPLEIGEQVIVLSVCGELNQGLIISSLYKGGAFETTPNKNAVKFSDGSLIEYDISTKKLSCDLKGDCEILVKGNCNITAETTNIKGNVNLAGGGFPIARLGDAVQVIIQGGSSAGTHTGTIISASSKVKSG